MQKVQDESLHQSAATEQDNWAGRFSKAMGRLVPDAITASILLLIILFIGAVALGNSVTATADAYYRGLWMLLPFTMQMTLIIVLSSVLGLTPVFRKSVVALSRIPKTANQVVIVAVLLTALLSYVSWGLGLALSPIVGIFFAKEAERKGIKIDFLFLLAVIWAGNAVWQFGLSASAPLLMTVPGHFLESTTGIVPLGTTIWSPAAIIHEVVFLVAVIVVGCVLMPKNRKPLSMFPEAHKLAEPANLEDDHPRSFAERLERYSPVTILLSIILFGWLYYHFAVKRLGLDINSLNAGFLFLSFLLHRNIYRFTKALQQAIASAWPVVVIYHLYAGVAGVIQYTSTGEYLAGIVASVSTRYSFPLLAALSGAIVSIFVPSSGGQWVIQGFVTSKAAMSVGVTVQRGLLALSIGDHVGNLVSPFWYVIVAGIARVSFREFFGYGLLFALLWFVIGVLVFTFAPC